MDGKNAIRSKTVSGLIWSFADLMANQGIQFFLQIILARLLVPEHFGLIGLILVFISISNSVIDSGFSQALIREKNPTQDDYSTIFYFNLLMSVVMFVILNISSSAISIFFGQPQLNLILRVLSFVLIINAFGLIQRTFLIKNVNFKIQTKINLFAGTISGIVAIIFAALGFGVWSLVINIILVQFFQVLMLWINNNWKPSIVFNFHSFKRLFAFGSKLLISGLIETIFNNIYFIIIGKFNTVTQLGFYTNAVKLRDIASQTITSSIQRVTYPVLSQIRDDEKRLKHGFKLVIRMSAFLIFPFMIGLAAIANPLIQLILGDRWIPSVIYFRLLCVAGMLYPIHAINLNILNVVGRSDLYLYLEIIKKILLSLLIALSLWFKFGVLGLVGSAVVHSYLALFINIFFSGREISYSYKEQLKDIIPIFFVSIIMGGTVYFSQIILPEGNLIRIIIQIIIGIVVYILLSKIFRLQELSKLFELILSYLRIVKTKCR